MPILSRKRQEKISLIYSEYSVCFYFLNCAYKINEDSTHS